MSVFLPFVMQNLLNTPLACSENLATMIAAALSGELNITALENASGVFNERDLADMALLGRQQADARPLSHAQSLADPELAASVKVPGSPQRAQPIKGKSYAMAGDVAIVPIQGTLVKTWGVGPYSGKTGYDGILTQIYDAVNDRDVKAIWMDINSGGGTTDGLFDTADAIHALREKETGKPIWAMASDHAYSAAFLIGTSADKLFVPRTGGVGSAAIIAMIADMSQKIENEGIKVHVRRSARLKNLTSGVEPITEEALAPLDEKIAFLGELLNETVARNLGISKKSVAETEGLDYMGGQAKAIGFVSGVLSEQEVWAKLQRKINR